MAGARSFQQTTTMLLDVEHVAGRRVHVADHRHVEIVVVAVRVRVGAGAEHARVLRVGPRGIEEPMRRIEMGPAGDDDLGHGPLLFETLRRRYLRAPMRITPPPP
jgi:hypothetical protein